MNEERRMFWQQIAEAHPTVTFRSAEAQLSLLQVAPEFLKGKTILVLGPGGDFALEKRMAEAGPELIVPLSYTYDEHSSNRKDIDI